MKEIFGIENNIVKIALTNGIKVKKDDQFVDINGFISLTYIPQYDKFVFAYGTNAINAGYVFLDQYEKDWILK